MPASSSLRRLSSAACGAIHHTCDAFKITNWKSKKILRRFARGGTVTVSTRRQRRKIFARWLP
jgi:hypothetical protein